MITLTLPAAQIAAIKLYQSLRDNAPGETFLLVDAPGPDEVKAATRKALADALGKPVPAAPKAGSVKPAPKASAKASAKAAAGRPKVERTPAEVEARKAARAAKAREARAVAAAAKGTPPAPPTQEEAAAILAAASGQPPAPPVPPVPLAAPIIPATPAQ